LGLKERRQREKDARRELILKAARELLHLKGLNGASMNQIAKKAELGVATLYSYFKNKEELFLILQEEGFDLLKKKTFEAIAEETDPSRKLFIAAETFLQFSQENKNYYYIINYFISSPEILFEQTLKAGIDEQAAKSMQMPIMIIDEGITAGIFKPVDIRKAGITFWALVHGLTQFRKLEKTVFADKNFMDIFHFSVEHFIDSLK